MGDERLHRGLVLGAAGLLDGWGDHALVSAQDAADFRRRNRTRSLGHPRRATGGGVTAGIDFGLALVAEVDGEAVAKTIQLAVEYAPAPPFRSGTPEGGRGIAGMVNAMFAEQLAVKD